ncbi:MAG: filamentous hemagglutinin N-terminal domain-containing protein [Cellvibrionaceae bacterium]|nr:filamentous hemagglutinin N-terminal domain-containing protein [Cellvibrionaceae bacterium]
MKHLPQISSICSTRRRKLCLAIAAQMLLSTGVKAAPVGGAIVGGDGTIDQAGLNTTVIQNSGRLAIDWESFNIAADERVQFIQPDASSVALNRILGNEASQIFGRLDANGHVILMNPNGVLFGENASINVGGLVASGLAINSTDFMNGEFVLSAVEGADGVVVNKGIINAATGGSVALVGRQVDNQGLISANLGSVSLAAGKEAVLSFDSQGLLGVRVSRAILQSELGVEAAVNNSGEITAEGGRILLTASVSQDIFSQAVNAEGLNAKTSVVMHQDGSFTLGAGADVINAGTLSTSSETAEAGDIVVLGENVNSNGAILANSKTANAAGNIEIHSRDTTLLTGNSTTSAINDGAGSGGQIKILGDRVGILDQSQINTTGTNGGGDINIGGGFQGKETQLRNAARTVVGKDALIEANAISEGNGGDVIVWADETTSFTGEINVRGGELSGDGGFVEVSGKENLRFWEAWIGLRFAGRMGVCCWIRRIYELYRAIVEILLQMQRSFLIVPFYSET